MADNRRSITMSPSPEPPSPRAKQVMQQIKTIASEAADYRDVGSRLTEISRAFGEELRLLRADHDALRADVAAMRASLEIAGLLPSRDVESNAQGSCGEGVKAKASAPSSPCSSPARSGRRTRIAQADCTPDVRRSTSVHEPRKPAPLGHSVSFPVFPQLSARGPRSARGPTTEGAAPQLRTAERARGRAGVHTIGAEAEPAACARATSPREAG
ncbi:unnamed protein product, partial [Prorocentrum cordatum]